MNSCRCKGRSGRGYLIGYGLESLDDADGHVEYLVDDAAGGAVSGLKLGILTPTCDILTKVVDCIQDNYGNQYFQDKEGNGFYLGK